MALRLPFSLVAPRSTMTAARGDPGGTVKSCRTKTISLRTVDRNRARPLALLFLHGIHWKLGIGAGRVFDLPSLVLDALFYGGESALGGRRRSVLHLLEPLFATLEPAYSSAFRH